MRRSYDHWSHASAILQNRDGRFDRIDAITTLKRAIDLRLKYLKDEYQLKRIPLKALPKGDIQRLELLGIARRTMMLRLLDIRNRVEHADEDPPDIETCRDLTEFAWYFLRSTDMLVVRTPDHFDLEWFDDQPDGHGAALSIATGPHADWEIRVDAVLPQSLISETMKPGWLRLGVQYKKPVGESTYEDVRPWRLAVNHVEDCPRDYEVMKGLVEGPDERLLDIFRLYFEPMF